MLDACREPDAVLLQEVNSSQVWWVLMGLLQLHVTWCDLKRCQLCQDILDQSGTNCVVHTLLNDEQ